jgi:hypothetical protein
LCIDLNLIERNWLNSASHAGAFAVAVYTAPNMLKMLRPARMAAMRKLQCGERGCVVKVRFGPFVSFDTKRRQSQMLRHAHFGTKGGNRTFAALAN